MPFPRRRSPLPACLALLLPCLGAHATPLHRVTSPDRSITLEWLPGPDGSCAGMRALVRGKPLVDQVRFTNTCSAIHTPFSPDGAQVVLQLSETGPLHVVPTPMLAAYLRGEAMADAVVYAAEQPGMPPRPDRPLEFLRWRTSDVFELAGTHGGGTSRYSYVISARRMVETCRKDAVRTQCMVPSPDGAQVVMLTGGGFHVVERTRLPAFLDGADGVSLFIPAAVHEGVVRPTFQAWESNRRIRLQGEDGEAHPYRYTLEVPGGVLRRGEAVRWEWEDAPR